MPRRPGGPAIPGERPADAARLGRRIRLVPALLSLGMAVAAIVFFASRFDIDWQEAWDKIRRADPRLYALAFSLHYLSFGARGLRWRIVAGNALPPGSSGVRLPSTLRFSQLLLMGWFVNSVAWLRLGEAYRAYSLSTYIGMSFPWSLGTVLTERIVDIMTISALLVLGVALSSVVTEDRSLGYVPQAFALAAGMAAVLLFMKQFGLRLARFLPGSLEEAYHRFHGGALGGLKQLPLLLAVSSLVWVLDASRLTLVVLSLDLSITLPVVLVVTLSHAILSVVPTPGGIGAVEVGLVGLLAVAGMDRSDAAAVVVAERAITLLSVIGVGGVAVLAWQITVAGRPAGAPTLSPTTAEAGPAELPPV